MARVRHPNVVTVHEVGTHGEQVYVAMERVKETLREWQRHDLRRRFAEVWPKAGGSLYGKVHVLVGANDDLFLERSVKLFCDQLTALDAGARCEVFPARAHADLRNLVAAVADDLGQGIMREIAKTLAR